MSSGVAWWKAGGKKEERREYDIFVCFFTTIICWAPLFAVLQCNFQLMLSIAGGQPNLAAVVFTGFAVAAYYCC